MKAAPAEQTVVIDDPMPVRSPDAVVEDSGSALRKEGAKSPKSSHRTGVIRICARRNSGRQV